MPEIHPQPALVPSGDQVADLLAACLALLSGDPEVGTDGGRGVQTCELLWDQPKDPRRRAYPKSALPAIVLYGEIVDVGRPVLCGVNTDTIRVHVTVITRAANNQDGRALNLAIQSRAMQLLAAEKYGSERFVEGYEIDPNVSESSLGEPRLSPWDRHEFVSESTTDFGVLWRGVL